MAFLLDTNCWIIYLKGRSTKIRARLLQLRPSEILLCSVVKAELFHGAEKYTDSERRFSILREAFAPYRSLPFDDTAAAAYGRIRHDLEISGQPIGSYDLLIAAIAKANDLTLVTHNRSEFGRIPDLQIEDWEE